MVTVFVPPIPPRRLPGRPSEGGGRPSPDAFDPDQIAHIGDQSRAGDRLQAAGDLPESIEWPT